MTGEKLPYIPPRYPKHGIGRRSGVATSFVRPMVGSGSWPIWRCSPASSSYSAPLLITRATPSGSAAAN